MSAADPGEVYNSSPPSDINSIVPGSIFQDDVPPPSFAEGDSSSYSSPAPLPSSPSSSHNSKGHGSSSNTNTNVNNVGSSGGDKDSTGTSGGTGAGGGHMLIEVNPTTQTILIVLGVGVGVLFLLGIVATRYISHKNKRAEIKKNRLKDEQQQQQLKEKDGSPFNEKRGDPGTGNGGMNGSNGHGGFQRQDEKMDEIVLDMEEVNDTLKDNRKSRNAKARDVHDILGPSKAEFSRSSSFMSSRSGDKSPPTSQSNGNGVSGIVGGIGTAAANRTYAGNSGTGSRHASVSENPRTTFVDLHPARNPASNGNSAANAVTSSSSPAAMISNAIASIGLGKGHGLGIGVAPTGYGHNHHGGYGTDLSIGIPPQSPYDGINSAHPEDGIGLSPFLYSGLSPSSAGSDPPGNNPFASPPLSASPSLVLDPFRTNNNSQVSLPLATGSAGAGASNSPGAITSEELAESDHDHPFSDSRRLPDSMTTEDYRRPHRSPPHISSEMVQSPDGYWSGDLAPDARPAADRTPPLKSSATMSPPSSSSASPSNAPKKSASPPSSSSSPLGALRAALRQTKSVVLPGLNRSQQGRAPPQTTTATISPPSSTGPSPMPIPVSASTTGTPPRPAPMAFSPPSRLSMDRHRLPSSSSISIQQDPTLTGASSVNNAWYRKRASVVTPEGGAAHVRLWKDESEPETDGSLTHGPPYPPVYTVITTKARSGSTSSHSSGSPTTSSPTPSPLRTCVVINSDGQDETMAQNQDLSTPPPRINTPGSISPKLRNGAAVFEAAKQGQLHSHSPTSPSLEPELKPVLREGTRSNISANSSNRHSYLDDFRGATPTGSDGGS